MKPTHPEAGGEGVTAALTAFCAELRFESLPSQIVERTKDLVLDHLGVSLFGSTLPWSAMVRNVALHEGARGDSTIYGWGKTSTRNAALVNGAAAHAIEFDDTHDEAMQHPGCVVIPAAIAIGEALDRNGRELIAAIVAGYEAQCRVGRAIGSEMMSRGFHATAACGVFGAAAAVANLLRASPSELDNAFGIAASMSGGVMQFSEDAERNMIKRLHSGLPAERGVLAALLAHEGFTGPSGAVEGRYGVARMLAGIEDVSMMCDGIGERFEIERISIKLYPCCKQFHSMIEAIEACRAAESFVAEDIEAIEAIGTHAMIDTHMQYRPQSAMAAQYSLPYATAAAIVLNPRDSRSFDAPAIYGEDVLRLADRVRASWSEELERHFPSKYPGGVRIRLRNGRTIERAVLDAESSPEKPMGRAEVRGKFESTTDSLISRYCRAGIVHAVVALDTATDVRTLGGLLHDAMSRER